MERTDRRIFFRILLPALIESLISQLFLLADSVMLGQMQGSTVAVAAVGVCAAPINLVICAANNFFIGSTATIAWHWGAGEKDLLRRVAWQSFGIALAISAVLSLGAGLFSGGIMSFVCSKQELLPVAIKYFRINAVGFFFQILTMAISAAFRGVGITRIPMVYNLSGSAVNVALNYLLIYGKGGLPALGVDGAAIATVISKVFAFAFAVVFLFLEQTPIHYQKGMDWHLVPSIRSRLLPVGLTSAAEQVVLQSGAILSTRILSGLPTNDIASMNIQHSIETIIWSSGNACGVASTTLFGKCLGEGNEKKARGYLRMSLLFGIGCAVISGILVALFGEELAALFSNDSALYSRIRALLLLSVVSFPFVNIHLSVSGAMRGAGDSLAPLIASLISLWVFRVGLGCLLVNVLHLDVFAYRWCINFDQIVRCTIVVAMFLLGHWKKYGRIPARSGINNHEGDS